MDFLADMLRESWHLLLDASVYILFGLLVSGLFRVFLSPDSIGRHQTNNLISEKNVANLCQT